MRLIDADDLKKTYYRELNIEPGETGACYIAFGMFPRMIDNAKTINAKPEPTVTGKFPVITLDTTFKNEASNINTASYDRDVVGTTIPTAPLEGFARLSPLSTIEAELIRHGRWIEKKDFIYCSECDEGFDAIYKIDYRFCPNCGARMGGEI